MPTGVVSVLSRTLSRGELIRMRRQIDRRIRETLALRRAVPPHQRPPEDEPVNPQASAAASPPRR